MGIQFEDEEDGEELTFDIKPKVQEPPRPSSIPAPHGSFPAGEPPAVMEALTALVNTLGVPQPDRWYQLSFYVKKSEDGAFTTHGLAMYLHRGVKG